jgi:hypothetical protein
MRPTLSLSARTEIFVDFLSLSTQVLGRYLTIHYLFIILDAARM